jgi:predicted  nucleic acid-binding Zn-ribbon protein
MKLFKLYKKRIQNRIAELLEEQQILLNKRADVKQTLNPKDFYSLTVKIGDYQKRIDELTNLLK